MSSQLPGQFENSNEGFWKKNELVRSIVDGRETHCVFTHSIEHMIRTCDDANGLLQKLSNANGYLERVFIVEHVFPDKIFEQMLNGLAKKFKKSEEVSKLFEQKAKVVMALHVNYELGLRCLNLAVQFAPVDKGCLMRSYLTRAKMFCSAKDSENCLKDIQLVNSHDCSDELQESLLEMENQCVTWNKKKNQEISADTLELRSYRDNVVFQIQGAKNQEIPSALDGIRINFDETKERHLVTDQLVAPGTPVIVEEPYAKTMTNLTKWDTKHCYTCLANIERGIPCPKCVFVTYCSEECLQKDFDEGHSFECACLPLFHTIKMPRQLALAFKILAKGGAENLYSLWLEEKSKNNCEGKPSTCNMISGFNPKTGTYDSDSYYQIHHLKIHHDQRTIHLITWYAVMSVKALDYLTPYFKDYDQGGFKAYVASLFIKHSLSMWFNGIDLDGHVSVISDGHEGQRCLVKVDVAATIYSVSSLISHSCDPNVFRQYLPNGKMAIITNRELNPGDELLLSYGYNYLNDNLYNRQSAMWNNFPLMQFPCKCIPCTLNWPLFGEINPLSTFKCPNCSDRYKDNQIDQIQKCGLRPPTSDCMTICTNCQHEVDLKLLIDQANEIEVEIIKAQDLYGEHKHVEAIPILADSIAKLQALFLPPSREILFAQCLLGRLFDCITDA